jgi:succinyl-CoA synthetase beta subunit
VKLHEYQAKGLLRERGVAVPEGEVADSPEAARAVAERLFEAGAKKVAVKAQVHAGGRGKGGGIKLADSADEAASLAEAMLGRPLITPQTGPEGVLVRRVLIEAGAAIASELYVAVTLDRAANCPVVIASSEGGMEIEEVAESNPGAIIREHCAPGWGLRPFQATRLAYALGLDGKVARGVAGTILELSRAYSDLDGSLVEINPLIVTADDRVMALDAKFVIDDNGLFRHKNLAAMHDASEEQPLELEAAQHSLSYVALDGTVGCMVNGAGLAMATMDEISNAGGFPANFLDVGGGASVERVANAFRILMKGENVSAVLINIFGGIVRCDRVAMGIIEALKTVEVDVPVVVRLQGTNAEEGRAILRNSDLDFIVAETLREAAEKAVAAAGSGSTAEAGS